MNNSCSNVYIATKLFSFFDREVSELMYEAVSSCQKLREANIYLPFRDSNMKVDNTGDVAYNIFNADILAMNQTDFLLCRLDGLSYDAGVGFEIGYCFAREIPIAVFTTDFMKTKVFGRHFKVSILLESIATVFQYEYRNIRTLTYKEELDYNICCFVDYIKNALDSGNIASMYVQQSVNVKIDIFIDICGCKYEWSNVIAEEIKKFAESVGLICWVSRRYSVDYSIDSEFAALRSAFVFISCYDENEPDLDSCVLQGYAYHEGKRIFGYETNKVVYYVEGKQQMGVNLMLEQSCDFIARDIDALKTCILKLNEDRK